MYVRVRVVEVNVVMVVGAAWTLWEAFGRADGRWWWWSWLMWWWSGMVVLQESAHGGAAGVCT
jgi:hypothetical protein